MRTLLNARCFARALARTAVLATVALAASIASPLAARPLAAQDLGIAVGATAPGATLHTLDGAPVELATLMAGKPTVLEFWATWCGNCKQLEPTLLAAHTKYKDRVQFLAIAVSLNQSVERVKAYQERFKVPFTFLYDRRGDASEAYDAPATSYVVVVNAAGKVVYTGVGGRQDLDSAIAGALR